MNNNARAILDALRINRYIMECKCFLRKKSRPDGQTELIDTLWNVN